MANHSQLACTASEVAAMVEGAVRHGTAIRFEAYYTDRHGQSDNSSNPPAARLYLLPHMDHVESYRPATGGAGTGPGFMPAMASCAIRWGLIAEQCDG